MANSKHPSFCCCLLPRAGIMIYTFLYTIYSLSGVLVTLVTHLFVENFASIQVSEEQDKDTGNVGLVTVLFTFGHLASVLCALIYAYAFILAYKRKWKSFEPVLHAFVAIALYGAYLIFNFIKEICMMAFKLDDQTLGEIDSVDDEKKETFKKWFPLVMFAFAMFTDIIPWLIQIYLIKQTRSYVKYVTYKKDEKVASPSSE